MAETNSWIKVFRRAIKVSVGTGWTVQPDRGNIRVLYGTKATGFLFVRNLSVLSADRFFQ